MIRLGASSFLKCDVNGALIFRPQAREITLKGKFGAHRLGVKSSTKAPRKWLFAATARQSDQTRHRIYIVLNKFKVCPNDWLSGVAKNIAPRDSTIKFSLFTHTRPCSFVQFLHHCCTLYHLNIYNCTVLYYIVQYLSRPVLNIYILG